MTTFSAFIEAKERTRWQDREHASHCSGRYGHAGWEFDTKAQAIAYINDQYNNQLKKPQELCDFRASMESGGVRVTWCHYGIVRTHTYVKPDGGSMRDTKVIPSPSDCTWIVPGSDAMEYCNYYR